MSRWLIAFRGEVEDVISAHPKSEKGDKGENCAGTAPGVAAEAGFSPFSTFSDFGWAEITVSLHPIPAFPPADHAGPKPDGTLPRRAGRR